MSEKLPRLKRPTPRRKARKDWPPKELLLPTLEELRRLEEPTYKQLELFEQTEATQ